MANKYNLQLIGLPKLGRAESREWFGRPMALRGKWVAWIREERGDGDVVTLAINVRPVLAVLAASAAGLYLAAGFGLAQWLGRNPYNRIGALDLLAPWRWSGLRALRGQAYSAQGRDELNAGRVAQGIFFIRLGLASQANDAVTRLALARLYAKANYYEGVRDVLRPQLAYPPATRAVLQLLADEAARVDDQATIAELAQGAAALPGLTAADRRWLQLRQAAALLALRRPEEALAVVSRVAMAAEVDVVEMRIVALAALGRGDEAVAAARTIPAAAAGQPQPALRLLALAQRAAGRRTDLAETLRELIARNPEVPEPRLFAMEEFWRAGEEAAAEREFEAYRRRFSTSPSGLADAARRLAAVGAASLVERCFDEARALGQPFEGARSLLVLAQIRASN